MNKKLEELSVKINKEHLLKKGQIYRLWHGPLHHARVAVLIRILVNFHRSVSDHDALVADEELITLTMIVALCHDVGRTSDYGEEKLGEGSMERSAEICKEILKSDRSGHLYSDFFSEMILTKDNPPEERDPFRFYKNLLHDADCLDIMRVREVFDASHLSFYDEYNDTELFRQLLLLWREFIRGQGDLTAQCAIRVNDSLTLPYIEKPLDRDKARRAEYERADVLSKVKQELSKMCLDKDKRYLAFLFNDDQLIEASEDIIFLRVEKFYRKFLLEECVQLINYLPQFYKRHGGILKNQNKLIGVECKALEATTVCVEQKSLASRESLVFEQRVRNLVSRLVAVDLSPFFEGIRIFPENLEGVLVFLDSASVCEVKVLLPLYKQFANKFINFIKQNKLKEYQLDIVECAQKNERVWLSEKGVIDLMSLGLNPFLLVLVSDFIRENRENILNHQSHFFLCDYILKQFGRDNLWQSMETDETYNRPVMRILTVIIEFFSLQNPTLLSRGGYLQITKFFCFLCHQFNQVFISDLFLLIEAYFGYEKKLRVCREEAVNEALFFVLDSLNTQLKWMTKNSTAESLIEFLEFFLKNVEIPREIELFSLPNLLMLTKKYLYQNYASNVEVLISFLHEIFLTKKVEKVEGLIYVMKFVITSLCFNCQNIFKNNISYQEAVRDTLLVLVSYLSRKIYNEKASISLLCFSPKELAFIVSRIGFIDEVIQLIVYIQKADDRGLNKISIVGEHEFVENKVYPSEYLLSLGKASLPGLINNYCSFKKKLLGQPFVTFNKAINYLFWMNHGHQELQKYARKIQAVWRSCKSLADAKSIIWPKTQLKTQAATVVCRAGVEEKKELSGSNFSIRQLSNQNLLRIKEKLSSVSAYPEEIRRSLKEEGLVSNPIDPMLRLTPFEWRYYELFIENDFFVQHGTQYKKEICQIGKLRPRRRTRQSQQEHQLFGPVNRLHVKCNTPVEVESGTSRNVFFAHAPYAGSQEVPRWVLEENIFEINLTRLARKIPAFTNVVWGNERYLQYFSDTLFEVNLAGLKIRIGCDPTQKTKTVTFIYKQGGRCSLTFKIGEFTCFGIRNIQRMNALMFLHFLRYFPENIRDCILTSPCNALSERAYQTLNNVIFHETYCTTDIPIDQHVSLITSLEVLPYRNYVEELSRVIRNNLDGLRFRSWVNNSAVKNFNHNVNLRGGCLGHMEIREKNYIITTPLSYVILYGSDEQVEIFLSNEQVDPTLFGVEGDSPLLNAVLNGSLEKAKMILTKIKKTVPLKSLRYLQQKYFQDQDLLTLYMKEYFEEGSHSPSMFRMINFLAKNNLYDFHVFENYFSSWIECDTKHYNESFCSFIEVVDERLALLTLKLLPPSNEAYAYLIKKNYWQVLAERLNQPGVTAQIDLGKLYNDAVSLGRVKIQEILRERMQGNFEAPLTSMALFSRRVESEVSGGRVQPPVLCKASGARQSPG